MSSSTPTVHDLIAALYAGGHEGARRGINARHLSGRLNCTERHVRDLVAQARLDGVALCGLPREGYYIAKTPDELQTTMAFLRARAMHSLRMEAAMAKMPLPDLLGQLTLPN